MLSRLFWALSIVARACSTAFSPETTDPCWLVRSVSKARCEVRIALRAWSAPLLLLARVPSFWALVEASAACADLSVFWALVTCACEDWTVC